MILGARRLFYLCFSTPVTECLYAVIRNHCRWDNLKLRPNSQVLGRKLISLYLFIHHTEREMRKVEVSTTVAWDWPRRKSWAHRRPRIMLLSISSHHSLLTFFF
ncbi:hypothetical protein BDW60DRAFT_102580 [Aspergillus nidulans var. acristatus]